MRPRLRISRHFSQIFRTEALIFIFVIPHCLNLSPIHWKKISFLKFWTLNCIPESWNWKTAQSFEFLLLVAESINYPPSDWIITIYGNLGCIPRRAGIRIKLCRIFFLKHNRSSLSKLYRWEIFKYLKPVLFCSFIPSFWSIH